MKLKIDIDGDSHGGPGAHAGTMGTSPFVTEKIGLVSSIDLDSELQTAFMVGADLDGVDFGKGDQNKYDPDKIKDAKKNHVLGGCKVIAVVGGSVAFNAILQTTQDVPWLALVGSVPGGNLGNCRGGVSLDSYMHNLSRKNYLKSKAPSGTYSDTNIFLYTNRNSEMHPREKLAWASDSTFFESAAGSPGGDNNANGFSTDFTSGGLSSALALIVSDDPFFRANRGELIKQVNNWLSGNPSRQVVYPSQIYASGVDTLGMLQKPRTGQSTLYGPDLKSAYLFFGQLAKYCLAHKTTQFGFFSVPPVVVCL